MELKDGTAYVNKELNLKADFFFGVTSGIPVFIGYLPIALAFGLLAKTTGLSLVESFLFSFLVFAGASQFMALNLIQAGVAVGEIILATFLLNLRHLLMSASLITRLEEKTRIRKGLIPVVAFGVTDETFSVAATKRKGARPRKNGERDGLTAEFLLGLEGIAYFAWVGGTVIGYLVGSILPLTLQRSMGIALYAMFIAILVPEIKSSYRFAALAIASGAIHYLIRSASIIPDGWSLVIALLSAAGVGALFFNDDITRKENEE